MRALNQAVSVVILSMLLVVGLFGWFTVYSETVVGSSEWTGTDSLTSEKLGKSFDYYGGTISSISPSQGSTLGGQNVRISGTFPSLANAHLYYTVELGGNHAPYQLIANPFSASDIYITTPSSIIDGYVDIEVIQSGNGETVVFASDSFRYTKDINIYFVDPYQGTPDGGNSVDIYGDFRIDHSIYDLATAASIYAVYFDGVQASFDPSTYPIISPYRIGVIAPPSAQGNTYVDITITDGTSSDTATNAYEYTDALTLQSVSPSWGLTSGDTPVQIDGIFPSVFAAQNIYSVYFGDNLAPYSTTAFPLFSAHRIYVDSPPYPFNESVDITIKENASGDAVLTSLDRFYYASSYYITELTPSLGVLAGGEAIRIDGSFPVDSASPITSIAQAAGQYSVYFGTELAAFNTALSPFITSDSIYVIAPPGVTDGRVDVVANFPDQPVGLRDAYQYYPPLSATSSISLIDSMYDFDNRNVAMGTIPALAHIRSVYGAYSSPGYANSLPHLSEMATIYSSGTTPLTVVDISLNGTSGGAIRLGEIPQTPLSLDPGEYLAIPVLIGDATTEFFGFYSDTLNIATNSATEPTVYLPISFNGQHRDSFAYLDSSYPSRDYEIDFPTTYIGGQSTEYVFVRNLASQLSTITGVYLAGPELITDTLDDGFANGWSINGAADWEISNHEFLAEHLGGHGFVHAIYIEQAFTDAAIEVDWHSTHSMESWGYVLLRSDPVSQSSYDPLTDEHYDVSGSFYGMSLSTTGRYAIYCTVDGNLTRLESGNVSDFRPGYNRLRASAIGDRMEFYINGEHVASLTDSALASGNIAFGGSAFQPTLDSHRFRNVVIENLDVTPQPVPFRIVSPTSFPYNVGAPDGLIEIAYEPTTLDNHAATLLIHSDDPDLPVQPITLNGAASFAGSAAIYSVVPNHGPLEGGNPVRIDGIFPVDDIYSLSTISSMYAQYNVYFGANIAPFDTSIQPFITSESIYVTAPAGAQLGYTDVSVYFDQEPFPVIGDVLENGYFYDEQAKQLTVSDPIGDINDFAMDFGLRSSLTDLTQSVTLRSVGSAPVTVSSIALSSGGHPFSLVDVPSLPLVIPPGGFATFGVRLGDGVTPFYGLQADSISIQSDDPFAPLMSVSLATVGYDTAQIELTDSIAPIDDLHMPFSYVAPGGSATESMTINNVGGALGTIQGIYMLNPKDRFESFSGGLPTDFEVRQPENWSVIDGMLHATEIYSIDLQFGTFSDVQHANVDIAVEWGGDHYAETWGGVLIRASEDFDSDYDSNTNNFIDVQGSAYAFSINSKNDWGIYKFSPGVGIEAARGPIPDGVLLQSNHMRVIANGSEMQFYVNGELMTTYYDSDFTSGRVGVACTALAPTPEPHYFDNFTVYNLDSAPQHNNFQLVSPLATPSSINPGADSSVQVRYEPGVGPSTGTVLVHTDDPDTPVIPMALSAETGALDAEYIVFTSRRTGNNEIWRIRPDGSEATQLTDDSSVDYYPAGSPDGTKIAFTSDRNGSPMRLFTMNSDGTDIQEVASISGLHCQAPSWHPDGTKIIFGAVAGCCSGSIYEVNADGTGLRLVTGGYSSRPFYSPDGTSIVFDRRTSGLSYSHQIFTMDPDGSNIVQLTTGAASESNTSNAGGYSQDGTQIAFSRGHNIWIMDADGQNPIQLTTTGSYPARTNESPAWSPDGDWIVFDYRDETTGTGRHIYKIRVDGTDFTQLESEGTENFSPRWTRETTVFDLDSIQPDWDNFSGGASAVITGTFPVDVPISSLAAAVGTYQVYVGPNPAAFDLSVGNFITASAMYIEIPPGSGTGLTDVTVHVGASQRTLTDAFEYIPDGTCILDSIELTCPTDGMQVSGLDSAATPVVLSADVNCSDDAQVSFYIDDSLVFTDSTAPFAVTIADIAAYTATPLQQLIIKAEATSISRPTDPALVATASLVVNQIAGSADANGDGWLDDPLSTLGTDEHYSSIFVEPIGGGIGAVSMARFDSASGVIIIRLVDPLDPDAITTLTLSSDLLVPGEEGVIMAKIARDVDTLMGPAEAQTLDAGPSAIVALGSVYLELSIIVSNDGGVTFAEIDNARVATDPISIEMQGVTADVDTQFYSHSTAVINDPTNGVTVLGDTGSWSTASITNMNVGADTISALTTSLSVFGAFTNVDPEGPVLSSRAFSAPEYISPGTLDITVSIDNLGLANITAIGFEEQLPAGWTFDGAVSSSTAPAAYPSAGSTGLLEFAWISVPAFPATITYRVNIPSGETEPALFSGMTRYRRLGDELTAGTSGDSFIEADDTPPVITLIGATTVTIEVGTSYVDAGATAADNVDGDLTGALVINNPVNDALLGTYIITYNVTDSAGNAATEISRTVHVVDTMPPVITRLGNPTETLEYGTAYLDAGATATDNYDGDITASINTDNPVNTTTLGDYVVTYTVSDSSGNAATPVTRSVSVVDTTGPVMTVLGDNPYTLERAFPYIEPGVTAFDAVDGNVTGLIQFSGAVDIYTPGSYNLAYRGFDTTGNFTDAFRTVNVVDTLPPVITMVGENPVVIEVDTPYVDPGATLVDNGITYPAGPDVSSTVDGNTVGTYTVTYTWIDPGGNAAVPQVRTVQVVDTTPPVITRLGDATVTIDIGTPYIDAGATATDNYDGDLTSSIVTVNPVNSNVVGGYLITYDVQDSSGNVAAQATRTVNVVDEEKPVITVLGDNPLTLSYGDAFVDPGAIALDNYDGDLTSSIVVVSNVNTTALGTYQVTYDVTDSSGNIADQAVRVVNVVDVDPPVITLLGTSPVTIEVNSPYVDAGATTSDNVDGDITASIVTVNNVDPTTVGTYQVTYDVEDSSGNPATQVVRTVNVVDTTLPIITLLGDNPLTLEANSTYVEAGATAADNYDGDLTSSIVIVSNVDTAVIGTYEVTYDVTDANGNSAVQVVRTVHVVDTTPPVITRIGDGTVTIDAGTPYIDAGATALDSYDGDITGNIVTVNPVDTDTVGTYLITYDVQDSSGNAATQVTRIVDVVDNDKPVITILGDNPLTLNFGDTFSDPGATAFDTFDGDITGDIVTVSNVDTNTLGTYQVTYDVTDSNGNDADQAVRTVNVVDIDPPVITLLGVSPVTIEVNSSYVDTGATASDNVDGDITSSIVTVSNVDSTTVGSYQVTYDITDSSGNPATQVVRTVDVVDTTPPIITMLGGDPVTLELGTPYTDAGATALDNYDGDLTSGIVTVNPVDYTTTGTYIVTYNVTDANGNAADEVTRTVNIVQTVHSADIDGNYQISLSELLEVVQYYNVGEYYCDPSSPSGYAFGPGDQTCYPHDSDYNVVDYTIDLTEILRLVQFFNVGEYHVDGTTEDGFAPGPPTAPVVTLTRGGTVVLASLNNTVARAVPTDLALTRSFNVAGYMPGETVDVTMTLDNPGTILVTALGLVETLPPGWTFGSVVSGTTPAILPSSGEVGDLEFAWISVPSFPLTFTYRVNVPPTASGVATFTGEVLFRELGPEIRTAPVTNNLSEQIGYTLIAPVGGEDYLVGSTQIIQWQSIGPVGTSLRIELLRGGIFERTIRANASDTGSYVWSIPNNVTPANNYTVRLESRDDPSISTVSTAPFTISSGDGTGTPTLQVKSPNGGELWLTGSAQTIFWSSQGDTGSRVTVELLKAGSVVNVFSNRARNTGSLDVTVPANVVPGADYTVRVTSKSDASIVDVSDAPFEIDLMGNDTTPPQIALFGDNPFQAEAGLPYSDPGATAFDDVDGDISANIVVTSNVDPSAPGNYSVFYNVSDSAGNAADELERIVDVSDTLAPVITLSGDNPLSIAVGQTFTEPGATASDIFDGDLTSQILVSGTVNTSAPGTYPLIYEVTDNAGNTAQVTRNVNVVVAGYTVLAPTNDDSFSHGNSVSITWSSAGVADSFVRILLLRGGVEELAIANSTSDSGNYSWKIPKANRLAAGGDFQIRVESKSDPSIFALSSGNFGIGQPAAPLLAEAMPYSDAVMTAQLRSAATPESIRSANIDSSLAVRLSARTPIDPDSVWAHVLAGFEQPITITWDAADDSDPLNGWIIIAPDSLWSFDDMITVEFGASDIRGDTLRSGAITFEIESEDAFLQRTGINGRGTWQPKNHIHYTAEGEPNGADTEQIQLLPADLNALLTLPNGIGTPYRVVPEKVFSEPVRLWLPIPNDTTAREVQVYYYLNNHDQKGWFPALEIEDWLAEPELLHLNLESGDYIGILLTHAGYVQLGKPNE